MKVKINSITTYYDVIDDDGGIFTVASFSNIDKTVWKAMARDENDRQIFVDPEKEKKLIDTVKTSEIPYDEGTRQLKMFQYVEVKKWKVTIQS